MPFLGEARKNALYPIMRVNKERERHCIQDISGSTEVSTEGSPRLKGKEVSMMRQLYHKPENNYSSGAEVRTPERMSKTERESKRDREEGERNS